MADPLAEAYHQRQSEALVVMYRNRARAAMATGLLIGFAIGIVATIGLAASFQGLCGAAAAASPLSLL